jgi:putative membrane protein
MLRKGLAVLSFTTLVSASLLLGQQSSGSSQSDRSNQSSTQMSKDTSTKSSSGPAMADKRFMKDAADGGMAEVELGQLASSKGSSDEVKKFGQRMVDDHGKANDKLKQLAQSKNVELPNEPSAKHKATKRRLEKLSGEQFDHAYVAEMLKDHKKDVSEFERESKNAKDPEVKEFASQTLPTLQEHLKEIEKMAPGQRTERSSAQMPNSSQH